MTDTPAGLRGGSHAASSEAMVQRVGRPRVHTVWGRWRPQLRFYDHRASFLTSVDSRDLLLKFRRPDDQVVAWIMGVGSIEVGPGHIRLDVASPNFDEDTLRWAVGEALSFFNDAPSSWRCRVA